MSRIPANPLLLDFPDHFATDRLLIRAPRPGDGAAINEAIRESHADLRPWMPWVEPMPSVEQSEEYARRAAARFILREDLPLVLFRQQDGQFVGGSGLHSIDWNVPRFEIGYWVRTSLRGQGYITEAVNGIARFAFNKLGAQRLEICCDAHNDRSIAVAERCGFTREARLKHDTRTPDGKLRDTLIFAKFAGE